VSLIFWIPGSPGIRILTRTPVVNEIGTAMSTGRSRRFRYEVSDRRKAGHELLAPGRRQCAKPLGETRAEQTPRTADQFRPFFSKSREHNPTVCGRTITLDDRAVFEVLKHHHHRRGTEVGMIGERLCCDLAKFSHSHEDHQ